jgi:hypothetical protein
VYGPLGTDPATLLLGLVGVACAVGLAIVAGTVSARVFLDAAREKEEERPSG